MALTELKVSNSFADDAQSRGQGGSSDSQTKAGWTIGGGLEWAVSNSWSIKGEYLFVDFGSISTSGVIMCTPGIGCPANPASPFSTSGDLNASIARLGVNYNF